MTTLTNGRIREVLNGLAYPVGKPYVLAYAEEHGADAKARGAIRA